MSSCCAPRPENNGSDPNACHPHGGRVDWLLYGTLGVIAAALILGALPFDLPYVGVFSASLVDLLRTVWWGILLGVVAVGLMQHVPKEYFNALLGRGDSFGGLLRAALAGVLLDLCSHGILMVAAKLYERGASLAQVMTFLIASPWNSITLTLILIALVGLKWTLIFIAGSVVIAILTGMIFQNLVRAGILPENKNTIDLPADFKLIDDAKARLKHFKFNGRFVKDVVVHGWVEGRTVMRWLFLGLIIAAAIRAFVSTEIMVDYFGPTIMGLFLTLLATTIIEVCSEGSTPIGAELVTRAGAPGNGFTFLMAGVATDYTEIMVIREFTQSWRCAFFLPLVTVPQVLLLGWMMNQMGM